MQSKELEDRIYDMAVSGTLASEGTRVVKNQLQAGIPVTYLRRTRIVREYPDGRIEVIGRVKKSTFKIPSGVEVIPSN
jgi:hypothetical protein